MSRRQLLFSLALLVLVACSPSAERLLSHGNDAFAAGDFDSALESYEAARDLAPELAEPLYNLGNTYYRQEAFPLAQQSLQQALAQADDDVAQFSAYNLGNSFFKTEQWDAAVEAYKEALRQNPDDVDAKYNLELALQRQKDQEQSEPDQESQDVNGEDEERQTENEGNESDERQQENQGLEEQEQRDQGQQEQDQQQQGQGNSSQDAPEPVGSDQTNQGESQKTDGLTEEQARQLVGTIGDSSETLQERLQQVYEAPGPLPEKDW